MNKIILTLLLLFSASLVYGANTSSWVAMNQNSNEKQKVEKTKKQCDAQTGATSIQKRKLLVLTVSVLVDVKMPSQRNALALKPQRRS